MAGLTTAIQQFIQETFHVANNTTFYICDNFFFSRAPNASALTLAARPIASTPTPAAGLFLDWIPIFTLQGTCDPSEVSRCGLGRIFGWM